MDDKHNGDVESGATIADQRRTICKLAGDMRTLAELMLSGGQLTNGARERVQRVLDDAKEIEARYRQ